MPFQFEFNCIRTFLKYVPSEHTYSIQYNEKNYHIETDTM